jgi:hypothetical protein
MSLTIFIPILLWPQRKLTVPTLGVKLHWYQKPLVCKFSPQTALQPAALVCFTSGSLTPAGRRSKSKDSVYRCQVQNCPHPLFKDKAGLTRHIREVHQAKDIHQRFTCPVKSCKRHLKGFARKYNLSDHLRRCHSGDMERSNSRPSTLDVIDPITDERRSSIPTGHEIQATSVTSMGESLTRSLIRLRSSREELEKDIQAIERTLNIMEES